MKKSLRKYGVFVTIKNLLRNSSGHALITPALSNAKQFLKIPTYEGSGQVVHPSVIDFRIEHGIDAWSGYRYWMVLTPYPQSQNEFENPSLYASHDGFTWIVPQNISNPLDTAFGVDKGFLSDPDMIYNPNTDQLWIYYRLVNTDLLTMKLIRINSDLTLMKPVTIMKKSPWSHEDNRYRSFCLWRESADRWHMWGGGGEEKAPYSTNYFFSRDGFHWGEPQRVVTEKGLDPFKVNGLSNWHMSAKPNSKERRVEFLVYSTVNNSLQHLFSYKNPIIYAECSMEAPTVFRTPVTSPVLLPSKNGWDNGRLYRCSFRIVDNGVAYLYSLWYSAQGSNGQWHLGYTEGYIGTSYTEKK